MKIKFITIKNKFKKFYLNSPNSLIEFMNQEGSAKWQRFMIGRSKSDMDIFRIKMRSFIMILLILLGMNKCRAIELSHVKLDGKVNYNFSELEQGENILKKPDFFIINKEAINKMPEKVILFPFFVDSQEAQIVLRDALQPFFIDQIKRRLSIVDVVLPERVGRQSVINQTNYNKDAQRLLDVYAQQSVVDIKSLDDLMNKIDKNAEGIIFIQVKKFECNGDNAAIGMRGYFFLRGSLKAAWVAEGNFKKRSVYDIELNDYDEGRTSLPGAAENVIINKRHYIEARDVPARYFLSILGLGIPEIVYFLRYRNEPEKNERQIGKLISLEKVKISNKKDNIFPLKYLLEDKNTLLIDDTYYQIKNSKDEVIGFKKCDIVCGNRINDKCDYWVYASPYSESEIIKYKDLPRDKYDTACNQNGYKAAATTLLVEFVASMPFLKSK